jgi:nucleoside-diphosphate-sugar epimerase
MGGVRNALDVAIAGGAKRFVHLSSIAALGWNYPQGADEKTPVVIGEHYRYGVAKGASEHVVLAAHASGEMDCTIVRPGDVYGPSSRAWLLEPLKMAKLGQLILPDGGRHAFTPVYIDDLIDGILLAAGLPQGAGNIYILWGDESVTCRDFFTYHWHWAGRTGHPHCLPLLAALVLTKTLWTVNQQIGRKDEISPDAMRMFARPGGYSIAKARQQLGFNPKVSLAEGMRRSEVWLKQNAHL